MPTPSQRTYSPHRKHRGNREASPFVHGRSGSPGIASVCSPVTSVLGSALSGALSGKPPTWDSVKSTVKGINTTRNISRAELKRHNKNTDAWTAIHGKVYNLTPYLIFHPGGEAVFQAAGKDGTKFFMDTHPWVKVEYILDCCLLGFLKDSA